GGAEYNGHKEELEALEEEAKAKKLGLWGKTGLETPAEYKARMKAAGN
ncbi:unnamed protein product, partial [Choristocarpus tenellus]